MRRFVVLAAVAAVMVATLATSSSAAPPASAGRDRSASEHERIVSYWTPERRASAVERDIRLPAAKPDNPGNGNGGGGGGGDDGGDGDTGSTTVTGATWTEGGDAAATTGKVFFRLNGTRYQCSASAVDSGHGSLVLSAGHCVHDGDNGAFATEWAFYPRYDGAADEMLGVWTATQLHTTQLWATTRNGFDDDAGFARVTNGSATTLEAALAAAGAQVPTIGFSLSTAGIDYFSFGYPAAKKYKGNTLTYCAGPVTERYDGNETLAMACDMTGGSSGGPWIRSYSTGGRVINSVNSYGYSSLNGVMFGPIFDAGEKAAYDAANAETCATTVCTNLAA